MKDEKIEPLEEQIIKFMRTEIFKGNRCEFSKPEITKAIEKITKESSGSINNAIGKLVGKKLLVELKPRGTEKKFIPYYTLAEFLESYRQSFKKDRVVSSKQVVSISSNSI